MASQTSLTDLLDELENEAARDDETTVGDVMEAIGSRGTGVFILTPAVLGASPLGMIPIVPTIMAVIILIFAVQIAAGRHHLWLPDMLKSRGVEAEKLNNAVQKSEGVARTVDRWFGRRMTALVGDAVERIASGVIVVLCLVVPPLEVVPGAALIPLLAVAAFGLAMTLRDGVLMLCAFAAAAAALYAWYALV